LCPCGLLPFSLFVGSISENKQRRAELSLSEPKGRLGKDLEIFLKTGKTQSTGSAAGLATGSSAVLHWIDGKDPYQQAVKATVTTAVALAVASSRHAQKKSACQTCG